MKTIILIFGLICLAMSISFGVNGQRRFNGNGIRFDDDETNDAYGSPEQFFPKAVVDNFAPIHEQKLWRQRYYMNSSHWGGKGSPVFLVIGGEGTLTNGNVDGRLYVSELAKEHKALVMALEHRYYGASNPVKDMSTENLKYLTSEQALEDLARFMTNDDIKTIVGENAKWFVFGGSYPGNMAAWFRMKYPHIAMGAWASSGPVKAVTDMYHYMDVVTFALRYFGGEICHTRTLQAMTEIAKKLENKSGRDQLNKDYKTCDDLNNNEKYDWATFEGALMDTIQGRVQYNLDRPSEKRPTVKDYCDLMKQGDPYQQYLKFVKEEKKAEPCVDVSYKKAIEEMKKIEFDGKVNSRQWTYQTCNEFGYFQTTTSKNNSFTPLKYISLDYYLDICKQAFGISVAPPVGWKNAHYGSTDIAGTKILFSNGNIDPWSALGVTTKAKESTEYPFFIKGTAHCADLYSSDPLDSSDLKTARFEMKKIFDGWVKEK